MVDLGTISTLSTLSSQSPTGTSRTFSTLLDNLLYNTYMNINIPTDEEFELILNKVPHKEWRPVYNALTEHGRLILSEEPKGMRSALYNHYAKSPKRPRIIKLYDGRCLVYLELR